MNLSLLAESLKHFTELKVLELNFEWYLFFWEKNYLNFEPRCEKLENEGLVNVCNNISSMTNLTSLYMSLEECTNITNIECIRDMILRLTHLKTLQLNFASLLSVNDEAVRILQQGLRKLSNLTFLYLNFHRYLLKMSLFFIDAALVVGTLAMMELASCWKLLLLKRTWRV